MLTPQFTEKFVAFIDVLGFKNLVAAAESGAGVQLPDLIALLGKLDATKDQHDIASNGPMICPSSAYVAKDLSFRSTQISDSLVVSAEISPAGAASVIGHCWSVTVRLMNEGVLCRGYITRGSVYHEGTLIVGSAYQRAYQQERRVSAFRHDAGESGTPFVEIDPAVTEYVNTCGDSCVRKIFENCVESDGEFAALFPFRSLAQSFIVGGFAAKYIDYQQIREGNVGLRRDISYLIRQISDAVNPTDTRSVQKVQHYIAALDRQLRGCDVVDQVLDGLGVRKNLI